MKLYMHENVNPFMLEWQKWIKIVGPEMIQKTSDDVQIIEEKMKTSQNHQTSYADFKRTHVEFWVGDSTIFMVSPTRGVLTFGKARKFRPRYIRPFEIIEKIRNLVYRLALSS